MTVHGAKGLEAPIVDPRRHHDAAGGADAVPAAAAAAAARERAARHAGLRLAWVRKKLTTPAPTAARACRCDRRQRERIPPAALCGDDARRRPAGRLRRRSARSKRRDGCWYELVEQGARAPAAADRRAGRRRRRARCCATASSRRRLRRRSRRSAQPSPLALLPAWLTQNVADEPRAPRRSSRPASSTIRRRPACRRARRAAARARCAATSCIG